MMLYIVVKRWAIESNLRSLDTAQRLFKFHLKSGNISLFFWAKTTVFEKGTSKFTFGFDEICGS